MEQNLRQVVSGGADFSSAFCHALVLSCGFSMQIRKWVCLIHQTQLFYREKQSQMAGAGAARTSQNSILLVEFAVSSSGWWFGCHFLLSHILGIIIPIDVHIFQRGSNHQPVHVLVKNDAISR